MGNNQVNYLDALPEECGALENILRHVSTRPRSPNWQSSIKSKDLLTLLTVGGPLTRLSRRTFSKLVAAKDAKEHSQPDWICCSTRTGPQVKTFQRILNAANSSLHAFYVGEMPKPTGCEHTWLRSFAAHAVYVTVLDLTGANLQHDLFDYILAKTDENLLSLRAFCSSEANVETIAIRCPNLRSLCLKSKSSYSTDELWPTLGPTLEVLEIEKPWIATARMLTHIQEHCRALQSIKLYWRCSASDRVRKCVSNLLSSYGAQLKSAQICYLPEGYCPFILDACPKAEFSAHLEAKTQTAVAVLREIGARLVSATVQCPAAEEDDEEPQDLSRGSGFACRNLRELRLEYLDVEDLRTVLANLNAEISALYLSCATRSFQEPLEVFADDVLLAVARNSGSLCKFQFYGDSNVRLPNSLSLRSVAMANPDLREVEMELDTSGFEDIWSMGAFLVDVVSSFVALRNLDMVIVTSFPKSKYDGVYMASVADVCCRLRCRNTYVEILKVLYLA